MFLTTTWSVRNSQFKHCGARLIQISRNPCGSCHRIEASDLKGPAVRLPQPEGKMSTRTAAGGPHRATREGNLLVPTRCRQVVTRTLRPSPEDEWCSYISNWSSRRRWRSIASRLFGTNARPDTRSGRYTRGKRRQCRVARCESLRWDTQQACLSQLTFTPLGRRTHPGSIRLISSARHHQEVQTKLRMGADRLPRREVSDRRIEPPATTNGAGLIAQGCLASTPPGDASA